MSVEAERRRHNTLDGSVHIGVGADNDGVLAAQFKHGTLDPDLSLLRFRSTLMDLEANGFGTGEGDEACLRMIDKRAPDSRAALA